ncbi:hypothetical protein DFR30_1305 [Thiogranum longum]|uniref:Cytochrome c7-like domain-containing protein n=1 Tax=Thiogranum longum TaxID=1537524 RepID=A0A4V2PGT1_9GAMM|nr:hypothetical protein [Thiogranum longum]TCK18046.1 hypothetical protein DFR30_1305 [Thiogranum longum]
MMTLTGLTLASPRLMLAADIETLLMPGKVIEGHKKLESDCSQCHLRFRKGTQEQLCLDCHKEVSADIANSKGFHGQIDGIKNRTCKSCHSEHLGRNADIVQLDPLTFNHTKTDFHLKGAHTTIACTTCHLAGKTWSEAPSACNDCHKESDPHKGNLGSKCNDCHTPARWDRFEFDHDSTDFQLLGAHKKVRCASCHVNERYEDTPDRCNSCHAINDVHAGANGNKCETCHNEKSWDKTDFDHGDTDFPLRGKHRKVRCEACHTDPVKDKKPETECIACHRSDDAHHGNYGKQCDSCHSEKSWSTTRFDHDRKTDFALTGKHKTISCVACHQGDIQQEELSTSCLSCHAGDDVHHGQEGKACERCHQTQSWSERIVFDHDLTRFPLLGLHATAPCEECHTSAAFRDTSRSCISCHRDDDDHKSTLGTNCQQCHNPNSWSAWQFDHAEQTGFRLEGAHEDLSCKDCHTTPTEDALPATANSCNSCHRADDIHKGRFGRNCARCHNTERFSDVHIN